jgi:hypothetical protein
VGRNGGNGASLQVAVFLVCCQLLGLDFYLKHVASVKCKDEAISIKLLWPRVAREEKREEKRSKERDSHILCSVG